MKHRYQHIILIFEWMDKALPVLYLWKYVIQLVLLYFLPVVQKVQQECCYEMLSIQQVDDVVITIHTEPIG